MSFNLNYKELINLFNSPKARREHKTQMVVSGSLKRVQEANKLEKCYIQQQIMAHLLRANIVNHSGY